jgi:hypothetical protein
MMAVRETLGDERRGKSVYAYVSTAGRGVVKYKSNAMEIEQNSWVKTVGAALRVFIIMTSFTDRYHDILYS